MGSFDLVSKGQDAFVTQKVFYFERSKTPLRTASPAISQSFSSTPKYGLFMLNINEFVCVIYLRLLIP